jgi:membrane protein CcdC involved in cytochrome C biogenesis
VILNSFLIFKIYFVLKDHNYRKGEFGILVKPTNFVTNSSFLEMLNILKWFPIFQIISVLPSTINRFYMLIKEKDSFLLSILQTIFGSITGMFYFIVFVNIPIVKITLYVGFKKLKSILKNKNRSNEVIIHDFN